MLNAISPIEQRFLIRMTFCSDMSSSFVRMWLQNFLKKMMFALSIKRPSSLYFDFDYDWLVLVSL